MKKIFLSIGFSIVAGTLLFVSPALAARSIDVSGASDHMLSADNIYPGFSTDETVEVTNTGDEPVDVYFKFDLDGDDFLADKLKLYVMRTSDYSYRVGGSGDRMTLDDADGDELFIDRLSVGEDQDYKIKISFDKNAGNEYQDKEADFDIKMGFEAEATPANPPLRPGFTGEAPEEEVAGVSTPSGEENEGEEELAGAESEKTCQSWPIWVWIMVIIIYAIILTIYLQKNYKNQKSA